MIAAPATLPDNRSGLIVGLNAQEIDMVKSGAPLRLDLASVGATGVIWIIGGRTDEEIERDITRAVMMAQVGEPDDATPQEARA